MWITFWKITKRVLWKPYKRAKNMEKTGVSGCKDKKLCKQKKSTFES